MKLTISCQVIVLISVAGCLSVAQAETLTAQRSELVEMQRLRRNAEEEESDASESEVLTCQAGWILGNETCYFFDGLNNKWEGARNVCLAIGSHLLEIDSQAEQEFINSLPEVQGKTDIWTGVNDITTEGSYVLASSGNVATFTNWNLNRGEPATFPNYDCVTSALFREGLWATQNCETFFWYLCERPAESSDT